MLENSFVSLYSGEFPKTFAFSEHLQQSSSHQFLVISQCVGFSSWNPGLFLLPAVSYCSFMMRRERERSCQNFPNRATPSSSFLGQLGFREQNALKTMWLQIHWWLCMALLPANKIPGGSVHVRGPKMVVPHLHFILLIAFAYFKSNINVLKQKLVLVSALADG